MRSDHFILLILVTLFIQCKPRVSEVPDGFHVVSGYDVTLVANEPLIKDPVDIVFDEKGRTFVLEMPGYPYEEAKSRIVQLIDRNDDGIYDDSKVFAEELELASSIMIYKNGILVAAPPYLLHVKDKDDDGSADERDTLLSGFSTGNLQHNYNGLSFGLDNWIYAANGGNSGAPYWWNEPETVLNLKGDDFRFHLNKRMIEKIGPSSGGYEITFDDYGRLYETHNLEHISQLAITNRYLSDISANDQSPLINISDHEENGLSRIYPVGEQETRVNHPEQSGYFSGACGITYYGGGSLGTELSNTVWIADVVLNLVHIDKLVDNGSVSTAQRIHNGKDFLASSDRSFRPVNMKVGPDGSMYIVDMYREVIEHPEWIPDEIEKTLDLHAGKEKGRIYKVALTGSSMKSFDFDTFQSIDGLVNSLQDNNQWARMTAQRLLNDALDSNNENEKIVSKLVKLIAGGNPHGQLHATHLLHSFNALDEKTLTTLLQSENYGLLENIVQISEDYLSDHSVFSGILELLAHENNRVRMFAAFVIGTISSDKYFENESEILKGISKSLLLTNDTWNYLSIAACIKHSPSTLFEQLIQDEDLESKKGLLETIAFNSITIQEKEKIFSILSQSNISNETMIPLLSALEKNISDEYENNSVIINSLKQLENNADLARITVIERIRKKLKLPTSTRFEEISQNSLTESLDSTIEPNVRIQHIQALGLLPFESKKDVLAQLIINNQPIIIQQLALEQLSTAESVEAGHILVSNWKNLGPLARKLGSDILLYKKIHHHTLLSALEENIINIGEMNFDLERRRTLLWWSDNEETKTRAEKLFSDAGVVNRKEAMLSMKQSLEVNGDITSGSEIFQNQCALCHIYGDIGVDVGPALTEINRKSKETLLHEIIDPNAAVDTKYINHKVETIDGAIHIGIVQTETDHSLVIRKMGGGDISINKDQIKEFSSLGTSMMPEGLEGNMNIQQMADLLAYLQNG